MHSRARARFHNSVHASVSPAFLPGFALPPLRVLASFPSRFVDIGVLRATIISLRHVIKGARRAPRRQTRATRWRHGSPISNRDGHSIRTAARMKEALTSSSPCAFSLFDEYPSRPWAAAFCPDPSVNCLSDAERELRNGSLSSAEISRTKLGHSRSLPRNVSAARLYSPHKDQLPFILRTT